MKKLMSLLVVLVMMFSAFAMAEDADPDIGRVRIRGRSSVSTYFESGVIERSEEISSIIPQAETSFTNIHRRRREGKSP